MRIRIRCRRLDYEGSFFRSRGPFTVPRSAQGDPVIIQAGQSGRGRRFAARWAELVFVAYHELDRGRADYAEFKQDVAAAERDPSQVKITMACYPVVAESRAEASEKLAVAEGLARDIDRLSLLSEVLNFDFATEGIDEPFSDQDLANISGVQAMRDRVIRRSGKANPTTRDFIDISRQGTMHDHPVFCGTAAGMADQMEAWFTAPACDGFVVAASHIAGRV